MSGPYCREAQARKYNPEHQQIAQEAVEQYAKFEQNNYDRPIDDLNKEEKVQLDITLATRAQMNRDAVNKAQSAHGVMQSSQIPLASTLYVESLRPGPDGRAATSEAPDIFHAACDGDVEALFHHKESGADLNAQGQPNPYSYNGVQFEKRWSFAAPPLVFAASFGRVEAVKALLAWGADPLALSSTGLTARDYAAQRGYQEILVLLDEAEMKRGAN